MNYSPGILREQYREPANETRFYHMGRYRVPLVDPRDVPRGWSGHPRPNFAVEVSKTAIAAARAGSFIDAYATGEFRACFETDATDQIAESRVTLLQQAVESVPEQTLREAA